MVSSLVFSRLVISESITFLISVNVNASTILSPFTFARTCEINSRESSGVSASRIRKVSTRESCAFCPDVDAVIKATGLCESSMDETVQSIIFFNVPGTPIAYSGVQIKIPSASLNCLLRVEMVFGGFSLSRSGLKCGISDKPSNILMFTLLEYNCAIQLIKIRLEENCLVLPDMASMFFLPGIGLSSIFFMISRCIRNVYCVT